jgi:hypothetical protein
VETRGRGRRKGIEGQERSSAGKMRVQRERERERERERGVLVEYGSEGPGLEAAETAD